MKKVSDIIDKICAVITVTMLIILILVMFYQILSRNLFPKYAWNAADAVARYCFIWATFSAAPMVSKRGMQITITILPDRLKGKWRTGCVLFNDAIFIVILALIVYWGIFALKVASKQALDGLPFSAAIIYAAIPFGCAMTIVQTILNRWITLQAGKEEKK